MKPILTLLAIMLHTLTQTPQLWSQEQKTTTVTTAMSFTPAQEEKCLQTLREAIESEEFWPAMHAAEALRGIGLLPVAGISFSQRIQATVR